MTGVSVTQVYYSGMSDLCSLSAVGVRHVLHVPVVPRDLAGALHRPPRHTDLDVLCSLGVEI